MNKIQVLLICFALFFIALFCYIYYEYSMFDDKQIRAYTHTNHYKIKSVRNDHYQWYVHIMVDKSDGKRIFKLYPFEHKYYSQEITLIQNRADSWYCRISQKGALYSVIALSSDMRSVEIYELTGD